MRYKLKRYDFGYNGCQYIFVDEQALILNMLRDVVTYMIACVIIKQIVLSSTFFSAVAVNQVTLTV
jgi:hypothetical protein